MKILFNCLTMEKGGAERVITLLSNYFSKDNDVSILTLTKSEDAYKLNSSVKRLHIDKTNYKFDNKMKKIFRKLSPMRIFKLKKMIIAEKPDVIISFLPEPSLRLMFIAKFSRKIRKIPKIISIRNDPAREYKNPFLKFIVKILYKNVDGMVYQTEDAKRYFKDMIRTKNQAVILNPIDVKTLVEPRTDAERKNIIVTVGRLEAQKNHEMLIRAFGGISNDVKRDFVLKIYGEGSKRNDLKRLIDELGLSDRVFLEGQIDDVPQKLNEARIFALSSHYEGMPNALMEAMAMGLACVSTDCPCGGPRDLIKNGENGILVENDDMEAMKVGLSTLMSDVRLRKRIMGQALSIRNKNSIIVIAKDWKVLINQVLSKRLINDK